MQHRSAMLTAASSIPRAILKSKDLLQGTLKNKDSKRGFRSNAIEEPFGEQFLKQPFFFF